MHLKCSQIKTKDYNNSWYCTFHSTFNYKTQTNTTSPKNFIKILQLNANGIRIKIDEIQQADVITIQETKLNQSHKTPNISQFTAIRTDRTHKQGGLLTYIEKTSVFHNLIIPQRGGAVPFTVRSQVDSVLKPK